MYLLHERLLLLLKWLVTLVCLSLVTVGGSLSESSKEDENGRWLATTQANCADR